MPTHPGPGFIQGFPFLLAQIDQLIKGKKEMEVRALTEYQFDFPQIPPDTYTAFRNSTGIVPKIFQGQVKHFEQLFNPAELPFPRWPTIGFLQLDFSLQGYSQRSLFNLASSRRVS